MYASITEVFTNDPKIIVKWVVVFAVLIVSYIPAIKVYGKVSHAINRERKAEKARNLGHVIEGSLVKDWNSIDDSDKVKVYWSHATYEYTLNGTTKKYRALFRNRRHAPGILYLYYINSPRKIFSVDDFHYENYKALVLLPIMFFPWLMAALAYVTLGIPVK